MRNSISEWRKYVAHSRVDVVVAAVVVDDDDDDGDDCNEDWEALSLPRQCP